MMHIEMNPEQEQVVQHHTGPMRVGAVAGAGKTSALIERVAYLVNKRKVPPGRILMISFSRAAKDEMKRRVDKRLPGAAAGHCVRTFHSIGLMVFQREGDPERLFEIDTSGLMWLKATERAYRSMHIEPEKKAIIRFAGLVKNNMLGTDEVLRRLGRVDKRMLQLAEECCSDAKVSSADLLQAFYKAEDFRARKGIEHKGRPGVRFVTFDDMIYQSAMLLKRQDIRERWAERWSYVLQDECQDESASQAVIAEALASKTRNYMVVGDPAQCHPPGVQVQTGAAAGQQQPIETLKTDDTVMGWNRKAQKMVSGRKITVAKRPYTGPIVNMSVSAAGEKRIVPMTPNHRVLCRWTDRTAYTCVTYLMYRTNYGFRVGWCQLFTHRKNDYGFHLAMRARLEKAELTWILGVHDNRTDASVHESIVAMKYGIPTATFEARDHIHQTREAIARIFQAYNISDRFYQRAHRCLADHGCCYEFPFYPFPNGKKAGRATYFEVFAANLHPGVMSVAIPDLKGRKAWMPIDGIERSEHSGYVYSLDVEKDHSYAANGIVVLNSVYGFRGAKPERMLQFEKKWPGAKTVVMFRNYRSGIEIVDVANHLMGCMPATTVITDELGDSALMRSERQTHAYVGCHAFEDSFAEAEAVAKNIKKHCRDGIPYKNQAVLLRMNRMTRDIEVSLATRAIPYKLLSGQSFFLMQEAKALFGYLRVMTSRADQDAFKSCVMNPSRKLGRAFIDKVGEGHDMVKRDWVASVTKALPKLKPFQQRMAHEWLVFMKTHQSSVESTAPATMLKRLREVLKIDDFFKRNVQDDEDNRSSENMDAIVEFATHFDSCKSMLDVVENVERHRSTSARTPDAVIVSTVHRAKGHEWQVVYIIQAAGGWFPVDQADLNEERRCFYVACTRAMDELWISRPRRGQKHDGEWIDLVRSRFVDEAELVEKSPAQYEMGKIIDPMRVGTQVGLPL